MAIINCVECKAEISDQAKTCPKCGAKKPLDGLTRVFVGALALGVGLITLGIVLSFIIPALIFVFAAIFS